MSLGATYLATVRREPWVVGYWRLNDVGALAQDYAARYGLTGVYAGSPALGPALIQDDLSAASYLFGPTGENMSVSDAAPLRVIHDLSIEAWVLPYAANQTRIIVGKMNAAGTVAAPYSLGLLGGQILFAVGNGTTFATLSSTVAPAVSLPSHVVATIFRGTASLYLNGTLIASSYVGAQVVSDAGHPMYVGAVGGAAGFSGLVSEVALYNGALSARRVARHYVVGQQVISDPAHITTIDSPVYS